MSGVFRTAGGRRFYASVLMFRGLFRFSLITGCRRLMIGMLIGLLKEWGRSDKLYVTIASFILFAVVLVFVGWLAIQVLEGTGVLVEEY